MNVRFESTPPEPVCFHEFANLFPMLYGDALDALRDDIRANGVREPIVFLDGHILDGRNRYQCARDLGIEYPRVEFTGDDALSFVISHNLHRRHLTESQRASIAQRVANMGRGRNWGNSANLQNKPLSERAAPQPPRVSVDDAAKMLNVSPRSVHTARKVHEHGTPELVQAVERGEISVSAAADVSEYVEPERQIEAASGGKEAWKEATKDAREKKVRGTQGTGENEWYTPQEHIDRARAVLGGFDVDPASSASAQEAVGAAAFFDAETNGLEQEWRGRVWLNPPYAQPLISQFMEKLRSEYEAGRCTSAIALTHNYTDTRWFQDTADMASAICFTRGRIKFYSPSGDIAAPTQGQAFFYFGDDVDAFVEAFSEVGFVVEVR